MLSSILILAIGALIGWFVPAPKFASSLLDRLVAYFPVLAKYRNEAAAVDTVAEQTASAKPTVVGVANGTSTTKTSA